MSHSIPTSDLVLSTLSVIEDPDFHKNIVELNFIQNLVITETGAISFDLVLTTPACPVKDQFVADCKRLLSELPGVTSVDVTLKAQAHKATNYAEGS